MYPYTPHPPPPHLHYHRVRKGMKTSFIQPISRQIPYKPCTSPPLLLAPPSPPPYSSQSENQFYPTNFPPNPPQTLHPPPLPHTLSPPPLPFLPTSPLPSPTLLPPITHKHAS